MCWYYETRRNKLKPRCELELHYREHQKQLEEENKK